MVRKTNLKSRSILSKGKAEKRYRGNISLHYIEVLEAKDRLEQALEILFAPAPFSDEATPTDGITRIHHSSNSNGQDR